tara:strand:- start:493 stop:2181 length:1689 start_codon:yes stop_codon:yes gene_type:complete
MASIFQLTRKDFMAALPELAQQGVNTDDLLRSYNAQNDATAGLRGSLGAPSQSIADSGRAQTLGGILSYDPSANAGMDRIRSVDFEPRAAAQDAIGGLFGAGQNVYNAMSGRLPTEDLQGAAFDAAGLVAGLGAASAGRGILDYDPNTMRALIGPRKPLEMPENNVLTAVDRISDEDLAAAVPFTRASGLAPPRSGGGRAKDPALYTPYSSKKQVGVAPSDWTVSGRNVDSATVPPEFMTAEGLQRRGFTDMSGFVADGSMANVIIDELNGLQLPRSVMQQGGHNFGDNAEGLAFMSDTGAMSAKNKIWQSNRDAGKRSIVTPMTMGTAGGDFNAHQAMTLAQAIRAAGDAGMIDPSFAPLRGAAKNNNRLLPEGMGLLDPDLEAYVANLSGGQRSAFAKSLDTAPAINAGVPSVAATRWATTDPNLTDQATLNSGYRLFEPEVSDFFLYPENHASYNAAVRRVGNNMTMGDPRPWYLQFPDEAYSRMVASTPSGSNMLKPEAMPKDLRSFQMNPKLNQPIDDQWVETNMIYDEMVKSRGKEAADMYAIDAMVNRAQMAGGY